MAVMLSALRVQVGGGSGVVNPKNDNDRAFYVANSGLSPDTAFSLSDHKRATYLATVGSAWQSLVDLERLWLLSRVTGVATDTNTDLWQKLKALG